MFPVSGFTKARAMEPSTWAGVALLIQTLPWALTAKSPEAIGAAITAALAIFMPERKPTQPAPPIAEK